MFAAALLTMASPAAAQPARAVVVRKTPPEAPRQLPKVRFEAGFGPAAPGCHSDDPSCAALSTGFGLRLAAIHPFDEGFSLGGAVLHARFAGTPDPSRFTAVTLPLEVHSGFSADAAFRFGLELGHSSSPGEACYSGSGLVLGLGVGGRARVTDRYGLSLRVSALTGFGGCSGSAQGVPNYTPPRQVALRGSVQALLESTFDL